MARSARLAALVGTALAAAGCGKPSQPLVYVDMARVWAARPVAPEAAAEVLQRFRVPEQKLQHNTRHEVVLEPLTSTPGLREELEARRLLALRATERLRLEMEQELRDAASLRVARDVERKKADLVRDADSEAQAAYDRLRPRMQQLAREFAARKARLLVRRAVLSAEGGAGPRPDLVRDELRAVNEELDRLEVDQGLQAEQLQREAAAAAESAVSNVQVLLDEFAQIRVRDELAAIERMLKDESFDHRVVLPDSPVTPEISTLREVLVLDPVSIPPPPGRTGAGEASRWAKQQREALERQVRLWARAKGWRLSQSPVGAKDVTEHFLREFAP